MHSIGILLSNKEDELLLLAIKWMALGWGVTILNDRMQAQKDTKWYDPFVESDKGVVSQNFTCRMEIEAELEAW